MGELALWQPPPTTSSLELRSENAKLALRDSVAPSLALKAAKQLVGSYAHLKPDQPETFLASIASVLAQYPAGVVQECVDPRRGLARKAEFLSIAKVVEWCDAKLAHFQALASYQRRLSEAQPQREFTDEERKAASEFMARLAQELAGRTQVPLKPRFHVPTDEELRAAYPKRDERVSRETSEAAE